MEATYGRSIWSAASISGFDLPAGFICYILTCLRCLWATAELQDSRLRGPSFQMGNFQFLPGTSTGVVSVRSKMSKHLKKKILYFFEINLLRSLDSYPGIASSTTRAKFYRHHTDR